MSDNGPRPVVLIIIREAFGITASFVLAEDRAEHPIHAFRDWKELVAQKSGRDPIFSPVAGRMPTYPTAIDFNPFRPTSPLELLAILCWPDEAKRSEALVTIAAKAIGNARKHQELAASADPSIFAPILEEFRKWGGTSGAKVAENWSAATSAAFRDRASRIETDVRERLFEPSGGYSGVANAAGYSRMLAAVDASIERGAFAAALMLITVARMSVHHTSSFQPSFARAIAILEAVKIPGVTLGQERALKDHWKEWGPIAPLWAGVIIAGGYPWSQTGLFLDSDEVKHGFFDGFSDNARLIRALSYGLWFADFATTRVSPRADRPLLSPSRVVHLRSGVELAAPPLQPLNPEEMAKAQNHRSYS